MLMFAATLLLSYLLPGAQEDSTPTASWSEGEASVEQLTWLDRHGVHHADILGRIVDRDGLPVSEVIVLLYRLSRTGTAGTHPLGSQRTGPDGTFSFEDVSSPARISLHLVPPEHLEVRTVFPDLVSGRLNHIGDLVVKGDPESSEVAESRRTGATWLRGTIRAADGTPLEGWRVKLTDSGMRQSPENTTLSDAEGRFDVFHTVARSKQLWLSSAGGRAQVRHAPGGKAPTRKVPSYRDRETLWCDFNAGVDLRLERTQRLELRVEGTAIDDVTYSYWEGHRWRNCSSRSWIYTPYLSLWRPIRAEIPGFLPVWTEVWIRGVPSQDTVDTERPVRATLTFPRTEPRTLRVHSQGRPVAEVHVDVMGEAFLADLFQGDRQILARRRGDEHGLLTLDADPTTTHEVFLYRQGFVPRRAQWGPGETSVELTPESGVLHASLRKGQKLHVRFPGEARPVALLHAGGSGQATLTAGNYDSLLVNEAGQALRAGPLRIAPDQSVNASQIEDRRARLRLHLPEVHDREEGSAEEWSVWVSRSTTTGGTSGAAAITFFGGSRARIEPRAEIESVTPTTFDLLFPGTGRYVVHATTPGAQAVLVHECRVTWGMDRSLTMPKLSAELQGSLFTYEGKRRESLHGVAGPRLTLIPESEEGHGWQAMLSLPRRVGSGPTFLIERLPPGRYRLFQHLLGETIRRRGWERESTWNWPFDAWGGISVELLPEQLTQIPDFATHPLGAVEVEVCDRNGAPVSGALVSLLCPLWEAWRSVEKEGSTRRHALDPIPPPPQAYLRHGKATLFPMREGPAEWVVFTPQGQTFRTWQDAEFGAPVCIALPFLVPSLDDLATPEISLSSRKPEESWFRTPSLLRQMLSSLNPSRPEFELAVTTNLPVNCREYRVRILPRNPRAVPNPTEVPLMVEQLYCFEATKAPAEPLPTATLECILDGATLATLPAEHLATHTFANQQIRTQHKVLFPLELLDRLTENPEIQLRLSGPASPRTIQPSEVTRALLAELAARIRR